MSQIKNIFGNKPYKEWAYFDNSSYYYYGNIIVEIKEINNSNPSFLLKAIAETVDSIEPIVYKRYFDKLEEAKCFAEKLSARMYVMLKNF